MLIQLPRPQVVYRSPQDVSAATVLPGTGSALPWPVELPKLEDRAPVWIKTGRICWKMIEHGEKIRENAGKMLETCWKKIQKMMDILGK